jgi:hypothetical protein
MLVGVIGLAESLLSGHLILVSTEYTLRSWSPCARELRAIGEHSASVVQSFFFLLGTLFEEDFPQNILLLFVRVIVFNVVIMRLIKNAV